jgi:S1-C subfamily serine protease
MIDEGQQGQSRPVGGGWLPANTGSFGEGTPGRAEGQGQGGSGKPAGMSGLWTSREPEATAGPPATAARPSPTPTPTPTPTEAGAAGAPVATTAVTGKGRETGRRTIGALVAAVLVAGTVGGAAGSVFTAGALSRGWPVAQGATQTVAAAPPVARQNPAVTDPANLKAIYKQVSPAVVSVQTAASVTRGRTPRAPGVPPNSPGGPNVPQDVPMGEGTGFVVDGEGHILTNFHVVEGATRVNVVLRDGTRVQAQVVGQAPDTDLALLQANLPAEKVAVATLGDSDAIEPGDLAVAIGTPFGLEQTLTAGIVSAVNRDFGQAAGRPMRGLIQTDAAINPGNSGGPLLNAAGEVIGVTTSIESPVRANVGVGFAIPSSTVKRLLPELKAGQTIQHAWVGISGVALDADVARDAGLPGNVTEGVLLASVAPDSPAARAGLKGGTPGDGTTPGALARGGDVIVAIDGKPIKKVQDLSAFLDAKQPGDTVTVTVLRDGSRQDVRVALAPWPTNLGG